MAYYEKGRGFPSLINSAFNDSISAVIFPAMSKVQDEREKVLLFTRRFMKLSSFLIFPIMVGFFVVSNKFIVAVLSSKWIGASSYIKIFCLCYLFNIVQNGNLQAIKAIGRSDIVLKLEIIKKTLYFIVLITAIIASNSPVLIAVASIVNTVIATIVNTYPNRNLIGYSYRLQIMDLLPNLLIALLMGFIVHLIGLVLRSSAIVSLFVQTSVGIIVYAVAAKITKNQNISYLINLLRTVLSRK